MPRGKVLKLPNEPAPQRRGYSDEEKGKALAILALNGGNVTKTAAELGIHFNTLRAWRDDASIEVLQAEDREKQSLKERLEAELYAITDQFPKARGEASYSQLGSVFTAVYEKWSKLNGLPPEIAELIPYLVTSAKAANVDLVTYIKASISKFNERADSNLKSALNAPLGSVTDASRLELEDGNTVNAEFEELDE